MQTRSTYQLLLLSHRRCEGNVFKVLGSPETDSCRAGDEGRTMASSSVAIVPNPLVDSNPTSQGLEIFDRSNSWAIYAQAMDMEGISSARTGGRLSPCL
ncbi:uncharacterized protein [Physcomitrium patens]|uniref:uncharacterized protein isoform X3 n=1 Tax=Physcomitrium patens TaxID=3218 RepID=UPI003CCCCDFC